MIKLSLDEGYVFDILSILHVKMKKASNDNLNKVSSSFKAMEIEIISQIGEKKYAEVISSQEYNNLFKANEKTFNLVDKVKQDNGLAKEVDDANYERYLCKIDLQKKFFNNQISEIKIGYK